MDFLQNLSETSPGLFMRFFLNLENRTENIRLVKGKIADYQLTQIKDYVNKFRELSTI